MIAAFDIGGTVLKTALVDENGTIVTKRSVPSLAHEGGPALLRRAGEQLDILLAQTGVKAAAIGVGTAGQVDAGTGRILYASRVIPDYSGMNAAAYFRELYGVPVVVENDVNAAAVGEADFLPPGQKLTVFITVGTGIGGAVLWEGRLLRGAAGCAGEIGHLVIEALDGRPCTCGGSGCFEQYASTGALVRDYNRLAAQAGAAPAENGKEVYGQADLGNPAALQSIDRFYTYLAAGLTGLIHTFNPDTLIIGGGVSAEGSRFTDGIYQKLTGRVMPSFLASLRLRAAVSGNDACIKGMAKLAHEYLTRGA